MSVSHNPPRSSPGDGQNRSPLPPSSMRITDMTDTNPALVPVTEADREVERKIAANWPYVANMPSRQGHIAARHRLADQSASPSGLVADIKAAFRAGWSANDAAHDYEGFAPYPPSRCPDALDLYLCSLGDRNAALASSPPSDEARHDPADGEGEDRATLSEMTADWHNTAMGRLLDGPASPTPARHDPEKERLREALRNLAAAEATYRQTHDLHGDDDMKTGRAWDRMRRSGDAARTLLTTDQQQEQNPTPSASGEAIDLSAPDKAALDDLWDGLADARRRRHGSTL